MSKGLTADAVDKLADLMIEASAGSPFSQFQAEKVLDIFAKSKGMDMDDEFVNALKSHIGARVVKKVFTKWIGISEEQLQEAIQAAKS